MSFRHINTYHKQNVWKPASRSQHLQDLRFFRLKSFARLYCVIVRAVLQCSEDSWCLQNVVNQCPTTQHSVNTPDNFSLQVWALTHPHHICIPQSNLCLMGKSQSWANYIDGPYVLTCLVSGKHKTSSTLNARFEDYRYAPHSDISVNEGPHIRQSSHTIIIL